MVKAIHRVGLAVAEARDLGADTRLLVLRDEEGWELPPFTPGAHIDLHLPGIGPRGGVRQYSLCGDPAASAEYRVAVLRESAGRGGSRALHDAVRADDPLLASLPRNHFPLVPDAPVVMVAGGIGITPFLSMLPVLAREGRRATLIYCARARARAPFWDMIRDRPGLDARLHPSAESGRLDLAQVVAGLNPAAHLYCCGPGAMIDAALAAGAALGERLHVERFGADAGADPAYRVELARSGRTIPVAAGETMLQALRAAEVDLPASCEGGICLDCKVRWRDGVPVHRELTMPKADRAEWLTPCVSGCASERIVLDL